MKKNALLWLLFLFIFSNLSVGQKVIEYNLADLHRSGQLIAKNRVITIEKDNNGEFIRLGKAMVGSAILLPADDFKRGKIEALVRGKDIFQGSFAGLAFHAQSDSIFDLVYCRPFNFQTSDSLRRIHMIQYAYFPKLDWQVLRVKYNSIYEKGIANPPKADEWFKLTLEVDEKQVKAYINDSNTPTLVVEKLNQISTGKVGIFGLNADFKSIKIEYK
ncbi:MAG: hypothetical protein PHP53_08525 [Prolixibacteraceae bacterium]|nr:hypothetical protein [Prolixibacteraceae bacterium]